LSERLDPERTARRQNQLHELLRENATQLQDEALRCNGAVPPGELESLERLARLVKVSDEARITRVRSHWPIVALFAASLLIVSVLLFTGPGSTEIQMDLHVDQLSFTLSQRQLLSGPLRLTSLGLTGIGAVDLPRTQNSDAKTLVAGHDFDSGIALTVLPMGELDYPELVLPEHSRITVEKSDIPLTYRLTLPSANVRFSADANGPLSVSSIAGQALALTLLSPKSVVFKPQAPQINLDLTFLALPQKISGTPLAVQDLSLLRIEDHPEVEGLPARRISTILSGALYLEDLNGKEVTLHPGEVIELNGSQGTLESLRLNDDITLQFRGRVRGIVSGPADTRRSLMPTWLEWLKARQGLSLLWGSAIYLFGLVVGVLRWLRGSE
jgi:hypothetical protein